MSIILKEFYAAVVLIAQNLVDVGCARLPYAIMIKIFFNVSYFVQIVQDVWTTHLKKIHQLLVQSYATSSASCLAHLHTDIFDHEIIPYAQ